MTLRILLILVIFCSPILTLGQYYSVTQISEIEGLFYTVQIGTLSTDKVPQEFQDISDINVEPLSNNRFRYSSGVFRELKFARIRRDEIINSGIKGAFIIAYDNGQRISLREIRNRNQSQNSNQQANTTSTTNTAPDLAQNTSESEDFEKITHKEAFREVSDLIENEIIDYSNEKVPYDSSAVTSLFQLEIDTTPSYLVDSAYKQALIKQLKADPGFNFNTWYLHNFEPGFFENEDLTYFDRLNITVNWDLLRNGLYENRLKAKRIENELSIAQLQQQEIKSIDKYEDTYNYIIYIFNKEKIKAVSQRIDLLNRQTQIHEMLYTSKEKSWEDILVLKSRISRAENMHKKWSSYNKIIEEIIFTNRPFLQQIDATSLPLLDIIPDSLFKVELASKDQFQNLIDLQSENIDLQYNRWKDWSLRPFARYNLIGQDVPFDRNYASVGLNMTMPIRFKGYNEVRETKKLSLEHVHFKKEINDDHELLNYFYEYQYKLEQTIEFHYKVFKIEEKLRKEIIKFQFDDINFHPITAINYMDELISVQLELLDLKQQLYLKLLKISEYIDVESPNHYTTVINPDELSYKYAQNRHIYIWSNFFNQQENLFLIHYLKVNEIRKVMLSAGSKPDIDKLTEFSKLAKKYNIEVHGLIGNNKLAVDLDTAQIQSYYDLYSSLDFQGIHFDVEPQTFPDWDGNQKSYVDKFVSSINYMKNISADKNWKINCSISMYYPEETFSSLSESCDNIYIMAYETPDIQFIKEKTSEEINSFGEKAIVSLRTKDFKNRLYFEKFITELSIDMGLKSIAIHDLGTLFELDNISSIKR